MQADRQRLVAATAALVLLTALLTAGASMMNGASDGTTPADTSTPAREEPSPSLEPTLDLEPTTAQQSSPTPTRRSTATPATPTPEPVDDGLALELVIDGLHGPSGVYSDPNHPDRMLILERPGRIRMIENGQFHERLFLDITDRVTAAELEQGLLGLAFHPRYRSNGRFYVYYTNLEGNSIVSQFTVSEDPLIADRDSEKPILRIDQPHYSHNGGHLEFGPEGYLYIALGDGENPGDPHQNAQNPSTLLGSILRIDVDNGDPYAIPPDNPFVNDPERRDEIWAYGLRNPWRFSFDAVTGDLYIADAGQWEVEEINFHPVGQPGGQNYGWPIREGDRCFEAENCNTEGLTEPIITYARDAGGCAIIGGYVYRGRDLPQLAGMYLFSDYCSGTIWGLTKNEGEWQYETLLETDMMVSAVSHGHEGEPYVVDIGSGSVYKLVPR